MARRFHLPGSVQELADWYMRYVSPLSLVAGFIADNLFLTKRVDLLLTNALLGSYLIIAALGIVVINLIQTGHLRHPFYQKIFPLLPVVAQYAFGGLFSGYLSLYSRSAAISLSWIFVVVLVALLLANERFAHFYARFSVQVSIYFTALFSFLIFFLPLMFHRIGDWMFIASGLTALGIISLFLFMLFRLIPELRGREVRAARSIAVIFVIFNILYFTNAIPPLPLALKDAGVYHSVTRQADGTYDLFGESIPWFEGFLRYQPTYHTQPGESAYVFTSIFAPSGLDVVVLHEWQQYNETTKQWVTTDTVAFPIHGGRDGGYRGYSVKSNIAAGQWRVNVITQSGVMIGQVTFTVDQSGTSVPLQEFSK